MLAPAETMRELAAAAVLGTDRGGGEAARVLDGAAAAGSLARAGWVAVESDVAGSAVAGVCAAETRREAPAAAIAILMRVMADERGELVEEWAELADAAGLRVTEAAAPVVLDWWARRRMAVGVPGGAAKRDAARAVVAVTGERGRWLAGLNGAWSGALAVAMGGDGSAADAGLIEDARRVWETGKTAARVEVLRRVRGVDAAAGLAMVEAAWGGDGAAERAKFVEALEVGLGPADEAFLERALDDRSKAVKAAAAEVLARLPGSALAKRMAELVRACLEVKKSRLSLKGAATIAITLPKEFDAGWARDGIEEEYFGKKTRAGWFVQIVGAAGLGLWTESLVEAGVSAEKATPEAVLAALKDDDHFKDAVQGMTLAVMRRPDVAWAKALCAVGMERRKKEAVGFGWVWERLEPRDAEEVMLSVIGHSGAMPELCWMLLESAESRWSRGFSAAVIARLLELRGTKTVSEWQRRGTLERMSVLLHPAEAEGFEKLAEEAFGSDLTENVRRSVDRVRARAEMYKELAS